ncbi:MAG TPA: PAS domain S-box protein [Planctomycetota bacterium]|nr:PAS domain S-box protein [Planctomycetota bacterium]
MLDFEGFFTHSRDIGFIVDLRGAILAATVGAERALGYSREELIGLDLPHLDEAGDLRRFLEQHAAPESRMNVGFHLRTKGGRVLTIGSLASSLRDGEGKPTGWFLACQDLRGAVGEARRARPILDALVDSIGAALWSFDRSGTVITWGRTCEELFGVPRAEAEGKLPAVRLFPSPEEFRKVLRAVDEKGLFSGEVALVSRGGAVRPSQLTVTPLSTGGQAVGYTAVSFDLSERKRLEGFQRVLFERAGEAIIVIDSDTRLIIDANERAAELHGYSREEMLGLGIADLRPIGEDPAVAVAISRTLDETGRFEGSPETHRRKDGSVFRCELNIRRVVVGGRRYSISILRDLTERRKAEEFFRVLFQKARDAVYLVEGEDLKIVEANEEACRLLGYTREELVRLRVPDIVPPDKRHLIEGVRKGVGAEPGYRRDRRLLLRKDGSSVATDHSISRIEIGGEPYFVASSRDLTEEERAARELEEAKAFLEHVQEGASDGIAILDERGVYLSVNPRLLEMNGKSAEEMIGHSYVEATRSEHLEGYADYYRRLLRGEKVQMRATIPHPSGRQIPVEVSSAAFERGGHQYVVAIIRDVTEQARTREELERRVAERTAELEMQGAHLRLILDQVPAVLWTTDAELRFTSSSGAGLMGLGLKSGEAVGRTLFEYFGTKDPAYPPIAMHLRAVEGKAGSYETEWEGRFFQTHVEPLQDGAGRIVGTVGAAVDTTESRKVQDELRQAHDDLERRVEERTALLSLEIAERRRAEERLKLYREIFANASESITIASPDGVLLEQNEAHRRMLGYSDEELKGKSAAPYSMDAFPRVMEEIRRKGSYRGETVHRSKSGARIHVELTAFPVRGAGDEVLCIVAIQRDITERTRAEEALRLILEGTSSVTGEDFFRSLVRHLASALEVRYALIARGLDDPPTRVRTLALWSRDEIAPDIEYDLAGTPCEGVETGDACSYPSGVQGLFPRDSTLVVMDAESYMGVPLRGAAGRVSGHLAVLDDKPLEDVERKMAILKIFAARAGAELERQRAEAGLRDSEERWRSVVTHAPDFVITADRTARILTINRTVPGFTVEQTVGSSVYDFIPSEQAGVMRRALEHVFSTGEPTSFEINAPGPDGKPAWYASRLGPIKREEEVVGVVIIATDITPRKQVEETLRFQKTLLESQSEAAIDGILVVSSEGRMISFNRRFVEMWEIPHEVVEARSDERALKSVLDKLVDPPGFLARVRYLYDHPDEQSRDEIALQDGRTFDRYSAPIQSLEGTRYGRVWYFRDVTGRKRTEEALRRAAEETRKAYDDLKQAQEQLIRTEKLASIGMLVSGVAHEINNPLNVMYGNLQLLAEAYAGRGAKPPDARKLRGMIRDALRAAQHARSIVEEFRSFARDTRTAELVDLNVCLEEMASLAQREMGPRVRVVRRLRPLPPVRCFRGQMNQVFLNLLKNAGEAVEKEGTVTVRTLKEAGHVVVEVADTGRGMTEEVRKKLFEPFFTTKPVGKGLGLGLSISAMIVHNHGGKISAKSRSGRGSVFRVELPIKS